MGVTKRTEQLRVKAHVNGEAVRQVSSFRCLGSLISEDGRCDAEIKSRIAIAKGNFGMMRRILTNLSLGMNIRLRLLKGYVWSTLLYGCEAWNISGVMRRRLEAAEMWFLRRMLRIPWTARRTNEEVLGRAGTERVLMTTMRRRQLGHAIRADGLKKSLLLGYIEGRRVKGRQRLKYMDGIVEVIGCSTAADVVRLTEDRGRWHSIVANTLLPIQRILDTHAQLSKIDSSNKQLLRNITNKSTTAI